MTYVHKSYTLDNRGHRHIWRRSLRRFLGSEIKEIRIFSRDEKKQEEVRIHYNDPKIKYYIGDVRDYDSIAGAMVGVDYVFHAAALKQVPSCEFYPFEALKTNAMGAENVMNAAIAHHGKNAQSF